MMTMTMTKVEWSSLTAPLLVLLIVFKAIVVAETQVLIPGSSPPLLRDEERNNQRVGDGEDGKGEIKSVVKMVLAANYLHSPSEEDSGLIPSRSIRKLGSEFLGKRSDMPMNEGKSRIQKRAMGSEFLGKRRAMGSEFLGKRGDVFQRPQMTPDDYTSSETMMGSYNWLRPNGESLGSPTFPEELISKNSNSVRRATDYVAKRRAYEFPSWKQNLNSRMVQFDKKRRVMGSEFLGKRSAAAPSEPQEQQNEHELTEFASEKGGF